MAFRDLRGLRIGRLVVIEPAEKSVYGAAMWHCLCDCGGTKDVAHQSLERGASKSCGCFRKEAGAIRGKNNATHGMSRHADRAPEWKAWMAMRQRCLKPKHKQFRDYGARGITVCDEWIDDFQAFFDHIGLRPSPRHSIDRIDNDRGYEPGNVRWATKKEQQRNRRTNVIVTAFGRTEPLICFIPEGPKSRQYSLALRRVKAGIDAEAAIKEAADA